MAIESATSDKIGSTPITRKSERPIRLFLVLAPFSGGAETDTSIGKKTVSTIPRPFLPQGENTVTSLPSNQGHSSKVEHSPQERR